MSDHDIRVMLTRVLRSVVPRVSGARTAGVILMAFTGLLLRFIRFLGPGKEPAEFTFAPGLNILWGSSDTGKDLPRRSY